MQADPGQRDQSPKNQMPVPQPSSTRPLVAPMPVAIGELVPPPPSQKLAPAVRSDSRSDGKQPIEAAGSLVIDVGERAAQASTAPSQSVGQARQTLKTQQPAAGTPNARPAQLREELATLPSRPEATASSPGAQALAGGEPVAGSTVRFAEPVTERPAVAAVPSQSPRKAVKITIVDISPDGNSVLVTDPSTRLPKRYQKGERLPNGQVLQSIDAGAGRITAGGDVIRME